ncbi:MAG TPA: endonuclease/exonuclease/phosphatase family protein [Candidatus Saccharimonadales bacterium]|nr:endonuclease/exonuclease/phosphatase family protein [Candidatus Saccharimonadales bacterium]
MIEQLRVVTWNAEGMFVAGSNTRRATPQMAIATIKRLNADVVFIPEFGNTDAIEEATLMALRALGYEIVFFSYGHSWLGSYGAALLSRLPLKSYLIHHFTNTQRPFIEATVDDNGTLLRIVGIHLDDRSEALRLQQVPEVAKVVNQNDSLPVIVLGDFNAMHASSKFARAVRARPLYYAARLFPHTQLRGMGSRVSEMGRGTAITELLKRTDLHDLDGLHRRTISAKQSGLEWMPAWRLAKIDWIFGSKGIKAVSYKISSDVGSDHRPVIAELDIKRP